MKYSKSFRNSILKKVLPPENRSVYSVAKDDGNSTSKLNAPTNLVINVNIGEKFPLFIGQLFPLFPLKI